MMDDFETIDRRQNEKGFLNQVARDSLWSDPIDATGRHLSQRGNVNK